MDPFAVEVGNGEAATAVFAVGDAVGDALVRPGRVVMRLVLGQDGAQVGARRGSARGRGALGAGYRPRRSQVAFMRGAWTAVRSPGAGGLENGVEG